MLGPEHPIRAVARYAAVAFVATLALAPVAVQAQSDDLATVLSKQQNVTTYSGLLSKYPKVFGDLPSSGATILVPTDAAFIRFQSWDRGDAAYAERLLQYHILHGKVSIGSIKEGDSLFARTILTDRKYTNVTGGAELIINKQRDAVAFISGLATRATLVGSPDIPFNGGSIQLIDSILAMPARLEPTARESYNGDMSSFLGALYAAGVLPEFANAENLTIFVPRNHAMQSVGGALQSMGSEQLARVLRYHLVPGRVLESNDLRNSSDFTTAVQGAPKLQVTLNNNDIFIGAAKVASTNILVANGVVHLLDDVLNPDAGELRPNVSAETRAPLFTVTGQLAATGTGAPLPFATALPCTANCPTATGGAGGGGGAGGNGVKTSSSSGGAGGVFIPRATGVAGAGVGFGVGLAMGIAGMGALL